MSVSGLLELLEEAKKSWAEITLNLLLHAPTAPFIMHEWLAYVPEFFEHRWTHWSNETRLALFCLAHSTMVHDQEL